MRLYGKWRGTLIVALAAILLVVSGFAEAGSIKERMQERLPVLNALKAQGLIGETNDGYLALRGDLGDKAAVVAAENQDRRAVYEAIAKQQRTTVELVGRRRALQIAKIAAPGTWLQNDQGAWYRKQ